jgi:sugar/nucleoside kinase (ribokinase family)
MLDPAGFYEREARAAGAEAFSPDYANKLAGELVALGAAVVVVKLGSRGLLLRWGAPLRLADTGALRLGLRVPPHPLLGAHELNLEGGAVVIPAWPAPQIVAATGAGDTAIAGVLGALLSGESLPVALEMGCLAGRAAVMTVDAASSARPYAELEAEHRAFAGGADRAVITFEDASAWREIGNLFWYVPDSNVSSISKKER